MQALSDHNLNDNDNGNIWVYRLIWKGNRPPVKIKFTKSDCAMFVVYIWFLLLFLAQDWIVCISNYYSPQKTSLPLHFALNGEFNLVIILGSGSNPKKYSLCKSIISSTSKEYSILNIQYWVQGQIQKNTLTVRGHLL